MNKEHTEELCKLTPILYSGRKLPITQNLMPFGFECGDGWYTPIRRLSVKLEVLNVELCKYNVMVQAVQVKEKFGTLHFYYHVIPTDTDGEIKDESELSPEEKDKLHKQEVMMEYADIKAEEYIDQAEKECMDVCEDCGTRFYKGNPRVMTTGWISILCEECSKKGNRDYVLYPDTSKDPLADVERKVFRKGE